MSWDMVTAIAVIIGAIAIVVSLVHIAREIRDATQQRFLREVDDFCKLFGEDPSNADIWWRASKGLRNLTDAERVRYFALLFILFRTWEKAFRFHKEGELEDWSTDVVTKPMVDFMMSDGLQEYWALRKRWYAEDFQQWVDKQIKERSGVDLYGEQFRIFGGIDEDDAE